MLALLRRRALPLLLLLAALVAVERLDLAPCADEAGPVSHTEGADAPHDAQGEADCLCHVAFAQTGMVPEVGRAAARALVAYAPEWQRLPERGTAPPEPVPLGGVGRG